VSGWVIGPKGRKAVIPAAAIVGAVSRQFEAEKRWVSKTGWNGPTRVLAYLGILLASTGFATTGGPLTISRDGTSEYVIVLPAEPTPVERTAARELQEHLTKVTGATLPITSDKEVAAGVPRFVIGNGPLTRSLLPDCDPDALPPDAIRIKTTGRDIVLAGHPRRGALYAVYSFLEDTVGVRWWTATETYCPELPTLTIPQLDIAYAPKVTDRAARYRELSHGCFRPRDDISEEERRRMGVFSARLRLNGHDHWAIPPEYGGPDELVGWVHTFFQIEGLLPPAKYFDDHPEWYSLIDGSRQHRRGQLCLTNQQMLAEMIRVVSERLREHPGATMISVSQNDWHGNCQCDQCRAIDEREGTPAGSLVHFVNAVAAGIEPEFPGIKVETLAYQYTRKPPKFVRPRHNVVVRLCSIECSFSEPLEAGEQNARFREDIEGWSRIAPQLIIWDYVKNSADYLAPHPNYHVLAPNIRYFVKNNAIGIFAQGDAFCRVGDFVRFRAWFLAHLLWNPGADDRQLAAEFLGGYYGKAGPYLVEYLDLMSNAVRRSGIYLKHHELRLHPDKTPVWLTLDDMNRATQLFEQALAAVADEPQLAERVRRERLPLDHVWLRRYRVLQDEARNAGKPFLGPADRAAAVEEFITLARRHDVGMAVRNVPFEKTEQSLRQED
jgi:hypothetical protein